MKSSEYEVVKFVDNGFELEVNVSPAEETVWLTQEQLSMLFCVDLSRISRHINRIYSEGELSKKSTLAENAIVQNEKGRLVRRKLKMYNLDMIIAVGYRVNSKRGTLFRQWANRVLKQYLLRGYAIDSSRVLVTQENYLNLVNVVNRIDSNQEKLTSRVDALEAKSNESDNKVFFNGQLWDAVSCIENLLAKAEKRIILIDNYIDRQTLDLLSKKKNGVNVTIITGERNFNLTKKEISSFQAQYGELTIRFSDIFHDRFIILDDKELYYCGASLKDAGRKTFAIGRINDSFYLNETLKKIFS